MSSHHIVKEGQEPALIIGNGAACSYQLLSALLEWSPLIVALDGAYQRVKELGIKPDIVIGDFDSIDLKERNPDTIYMKDQNQNNTDLEKAIEYLISREFRDINLVWLTGKRMDHTVNNVGTLGRYSEINLVMYDDQNKIFLLPQKFEKHYEQGDPISLIPLGVVQGIVTTGLTFNLNNEQLDLAARSGSSNSVATSGLVQITYEQGKLLLMESYDEVLNS